MKYRKKPVIVEAEQWWGWDMPSKVKVQPLPFFKMLTIGFSLGIRENSTPPQRLGWIKTLEGGHIVTPGDYIITGVQGERYPRKPDIFEQTYEKVEI